MQKSKRVSPKFRYNLLRVIIIFLCVIVTPIFVHPLGRLFDGVGYGQLTDFARELLVCLFWALELIGMVIFDSVRYKKAVEKGLLKSGAELEREAILQEAAVSESGEEVTLSEEKPAQEAPVLTKAEKRAARKSRLKDAFKKLKELKILQAAVLPWKTVGLITLICVACVTLITLQIGLQVKPFYDIGEKVTGYELMTKLAILLRNFVKCFFILWLLHLTNAMSEEICYRLRDKVTGFWKTALPYLVTGALMLVFGVYDALVYNQEFWWTYLLFYCAITAVYFLTDKHPIKTFLLMIFIYFF